MENITLRALIKQNIIDENQKILCYKWENKKGWISQFKGYAHDLKNDEILDCENISIAEIRKEDLQHLINNNFKKDYIGIYYNL